MVKQRHRRHVKAVGNSVALVVVVAGLVALVAWGTDKLFFNPAVVSAPAAKKVALASPRQTSPSPSPASLPTYQILSLQKQGSTARLEIVTSEKNNSRLIALNDYLYPQYKGTYSSFFIDYFDDAAVAATYFSQENDPKVSATTKNQLRSHYIAVMVDNPELKLSELYRPGAPGSVLKKY